MAQENVSEAGVQTEAGFWKKVMDCANLRGWPYPGCGEQCGYRNKDKGDCPLLAHFGPKPEKPKVDGPMAEALRKWTGE